jgi:hypothetical protein
MTTYTTPHFANGSTDRNVRSDRESINRARPAPAATYRTAGVSNEGAVLAAGPTPDWQPGIASKGVPKAAIGALGAALVGGVALAIVLMAPSNKVTKTALPDPIAQAAAANTSTQKSNDATDAAVKQLNDQVPAAGTAATTDAAPTTEPAQAAAVPAPVQATIPQAPPVAVAPVARVPKHVAAPIRQSAPVVTPDAPAAVNSPSVEPQAPAMQQTPVEPTVTPEVPTPAPVQSTPAPDTPTPAPAQ